MVFEHPLVKEILEKYRVVWALGHAQAIMGWDSQTYMPPQGNTERGIARAEISVLSRSLLLREELVSLVEKAKDKLDELNVYERGVVRVLDRQITRVSKIPPELVYERAKTAQEANMAWRQAKEKDDYSLFKPYLAKLIEINRKVAEHLGYEEHPYNALLDLYEEGLTIRDMDAVFDTIIPFSKKVLEKVTEEGYYPRSHPLEEREYEKQWMEEVNRKVLDLLGYPWDRGRLDVSPHPFTIGIGINDVRITTRYEGKDFRRTLYATIHEFGHALYNLQVNPAFMATPLTGGASLGVHESQSRFWENIVGRSRVFVEKLKPILDEHLPFTRDLDVEELYRYFNMVRPSLIRVDADEVTYNFHIYLRYQLEKLMIAGEVGVDDLPELWSNMMEELLGVRPKSYKDGILQDIHWSGGTIGYFPTYTLGNVIAAQILATADRELGGLHELVAQGELSRIREYLREKIHQWGATFPPKELVAKATGEPVNPEYFNKYLDRKFLQKKI